MTGPGFIRVPRRSSSAPLPAPSPTLPEDVVRVRTASELLDISFQLLRRHYASFLALGALFEIPRLVIDREVLLRYGLVNGNFFRDTWGVLGTQSESLTVTAMLAFLVGMMLSVVRKGALIVAASDGYRGQPIDIAGVLRQTWPRIPSLIGSNILVSIVVGIGCLFLLVGGIYAYVALFAAPVVVMLENAGPTGSLSRSRFLADGVKGHVSKTIGLGWIIYILLAAIPTAITAYLASAANLGRVQLIVSHLVVILFEPIISILLVVLYYDVRTRVEGKRIQNAA